MQHSDSLASLAAALSKAQAEIHPAVKDKLNPHLKTRYASLDSVMDAVKGPLASHGLSVVQMPDADEPGYLALTTRLMHASGEWLEGRCRIRLGKDDAQGFGAALSYAKRYALAAMLGVASDEDDDGEGAKAQPARQQQAPRAQAQQARPAAQASDQGAELLSAAGAQKLHASLGALIADTAYAKTDHVTLASKHFKREITSLTDLTRREAAALRDYVEGITGKGAA